MQQHFQESDNFIYRYRSAAFLINRVIAIYRYCPNKWGLVAENPEDDGKSVTVWDDNLGYCGDVIGTFDYTPNLKESLTGLGEHGQPAAAQIWQLSETLEIPLGDFAQTIFGTMIERDGVPVS